MVISLPFLKQSIKLIDQDDASTSSATMPVDAISIGKGQSHNVSTSKQVRFALNLNKQYPNIDLLKDEVKPLWYSPSEYRMFRVSASDTAQQIVATEKRNRAPYSYQRVMERTYAVCCEAVTSDQEQRHCQLAPSDFVHLQRWLEVATTRVGLEKWSIRTIATDKSVRREAMTEAVMDAQTSCLDSFENNMQDQDDTAEFMRATCDRLSRPSRLFSRTLAQGLAAAVAKENLEESELLLKY